MIENQIIFCTKMYGGYLQTAEKFNHLYNQTAIETKGNIVSFLVDDCGKPIDVTIYGNRLNHVFYGPDFPCVWYDNGKDVVAEETVDGYKIQRVFREIKGGRKADKLFSMIANGLEVTTRMIDFYTRSISGKVPVFEA